MTRKFTSYSKHTTNDKLLRRHVSRTIKFEKWWNIKWNWVDRHTARQKKKKNLNKFEPRIREETNWKITTSSRKTDETENPISTNTWVSNPKVDKAIKPNPNPWKGRWNFGVGVKALTDSFKTCGRNVVSATFDCQLNEVSWVVKWLKKKVSFFIKQPRFLHFMLKKCSQHLIVNLTR